MKILLDCSCVTPPLTGIGRYTLALAKRLAHNSAIENILFFKLGRLKNDPNSLFTSDSFSDSIKKRPGLFLNVAKLLYRSLKILFFKSFSVFYRNYIYHSPTSLLMPFSGKCIVTLHDLSCIVESTYQPRYRRLFFKRQIQRTVKRATHIITGSEFSRLEIIKILGVPSEKVTTIYHGVDEKYKLYKEADCLEVLYKYKLKYKSYCLSVATIEPRKNFSRLLAAFQILPFELRKAFPLVIVGDKGWLSEDIHQAIAVLVRAGEAIKLGYVAEQDLLKLYACATLVAYPSLYEGFGLPVLEAMACGTAVLSSNTTSIPEVAGQACLLVDPLSIEEIHRGLFTLITDTKKRNQLEVAGLARAKQFTWEKCVAETIKVYERCV
jgi:glycosyltransferase involved in cell wall biosynthesis